MACGSCKTCAARCSNHPVSCGHAPSQRPSPMISQKLSEPPHNLPMKSEPALADLHRIPDATHPAGLSSSDHDLLPPETGHLPHLDSRSRYHQLERHASTLRANGQEQQYLRDAGGTVTQVGCAVRAVFDDSFGVGPAEAVVPGAPDRPLPGSIRFRLRPTMTRCALG